MSIVNNEHRNLKIWIWVLPLIFLLGGCGTADEAGDDKPENAGSTQEQSTLSAVTVELREGTNLSFAVDPNKSLLVLALQGQLFRMPIEGGDAVPLFETYDDAREPTIDPSTGDVVFQSYRSGTWDLWRVPAEGGEPAPITADLFDDREPHVNLRGDVVFSSDRENGYNLWVVRSSDSKQTPVQLTKEEGNAHSPAWSPDGMRIAYVVDGAVGGVVGGASNGAGGLLRILDLDDGERRTLISETGTVSGIAWSPDGLVLSYQLLARDASGAAVTELKRIDFVGGTSTTLSQPGADVFPFRAAWLPDGGILHAADGRLIQVNAEGGDLKEIPFLAKVELRRQPYTFKRRDHNDASTRQALGIVAPVLSPDGSQIAFTALGDLWLWNPDSKELHRLTEDEAAEQFPAFFPVGGSLAYVTDRDGPQKIIVRDLASGSETPVEIPGANSLSYPAVSPDGNRIALFRNVSGSPFAAQLVVVELQTGVATDVGKPIPPQLVSFSRDGSHILTSRLKTYSSRYREGVQELVFHDLENGSERTLVPKSHHSLLDAALARDGRSVTFVQDALLWRLELDAAGNPAEQATQLTNELTDQPSFSANGGRLVFSSGGALKRLDVKSGAVVDVTPPLPWAPAIAEERWVLRAGRVYDGRLDSYRTAIDIVIHGQRIESLEPARADRTERVVDASDKTVIPGLFEMHAHMGNTSGRQGRVWLAYGITSVRDPGAHPYVARERKESWDSGQRPGPRTYTTGYLTDGNRVFYAMAEGITGVEHLERSLSRAKALEYDFIKTYVRLPDALQARVIDFAHGEGIPVSSHELYPATAIGMDHVEHFGGTSRRGYQPKVSALGHSYADVEELLVKSGMGVTPTLVLPGFAVIAATEPDLFTTSQFKAFYGESMATAARSAMPASAGGAEAVAAANGDLLRRLVQRDALVVTGTDSPFVPYAAGLHAELRLYARAGLRPAQILHAATWKSAIAARVEHDLGSIEVGKLADLVVIDGDPLTRIADADNVVMTVKGGRIYSLEDLGVVTPRVNADVVRAEVSAADVSAADLTQDESTAPQAVETTEEQAAP